jgi:hypothetical protein
MCIATCFVLVRPSVSFRAFSRELVILLGGRCRRRRNLLLLLKSLSPDGGPMGRGPFATPNQTTRRQTVNDDLGGIVLTGHAEFGRGIIERVFVVPIMPTFTKGKKGHDRIFGGMDGIVVRVVTVQMSGGIDQKGTMQDETIPESTGNEKTIVKGFIPKVTCDLGGENVTHVRGEPGIKKFLKPNDGVFE